MSIQNLVRGAARRLARSWRKHPLVMGMMMGLTLNMSLIPALQPISAVAAPPADQGNVHQIDRPGEVVLGVDGVIAQQKEIWGTLFSKDWSEEHWTYPLENEVTDRGSYGGITRDGETFSLDVLVWVPLDPFSLDLPDDQKNWAVEREYRTGAVVGYLKSNLATLAVVGTFVHAIDDGGETRDFFMVDSLTDAGGGIFTAAADAANVLREAEKDAQQTFELALDEIEQTYGQIERAQQQGGGDCAAGCYDTYNQSVAQANAAYQIAVDAATVTRDTAVAAANAAYNAAIAAAQTTMEGCMLEAIAVKTLCSFALIGCGFFVLGCLAVCMATFAIMTALCISNFNAAKTAAQTTLTTAIAAINAAYNAAITAASLTLNNAINAAAQALQNCLRNCGVRPAPIVPVQQQGAGSIAEQ